VTRTPTGLAYQLSGTWSANWTGQFCYLNGQPFLSLQNVTYHVTAVANQLDIQVSGGDFLGRGLTLGSNGVVHTTFPKTSANICNLTGVAEQFVFDYTFTFNANGTGSASVHWTYGFNTNCASCAVDDTATLRRTGGPGS